MAATARIIKPDRYIVLAFSPNGPVCKMCPKTALGIVQVNVFGDLETARELVRDGSEIDEACVFVIIGYDPSGHCAYQRGGYAPSPDKYGKSGLCIESLASCGNVLCGAAGDLKSLAEEIKRGQRRE